MSGSGGTGAPSRGALVVASLAGVALVAGAVYHHVTYGSSVWLGGVVVATGLALVYGTGWLADSRVEPDDYPLVVATALGSGLVVAGAGVGVQSLVGATPTVRNGGAGVAFLAGAGALGGFLAGAGVGHHRRLKRRVARAESTADRLAEERGRFEALNRATRGLLRADDRETVAVTLVEEGGVGLPGPFAGVWYYVEERDRLVPQATTSTDPEFEPKQLWPDGGAMRAFEGGEPTFVEDEGLPDLDRLYAVPLGEYGLLVVGAPREFDERDRDLAEVYGRTALAALNRIEHERELERHNERLEAFASVLAHDLRNPLNVVEGRAELARETGDVDHLDAVFRSIDRMETIIANVLELARGGDAVQEPTPVRLPELVEDAWANVDTGDADLSVEFLPTVQGDPDRLQRLFENLFRNSVEHGSTSVRLGDDEGSDRGGAGVRVTVGLLDDRTGFYVADNGPGIPPGERDRVLEEGFSTDDGTGLGLAIVRQITDAHGWRIDVTESDEGGARFEFGLPES